MAPDVEIVVARLPERLGRPQGKPSCHALLQRLHSLCQRATFRFTHQQMHMFGHDHVTVDAELILLAHPFQRGEERTACDRTHQIRFPTIATKREEMDTMTLLDALQSPWHASEVNEECRMKTVTHEHQKPRPSEA